MLTVLGLDEARALLTARFGQRITDPETLPLWAALNRVLAEDVCAAADVPGFARSTVDGYAVRARDTFGCSESIPALLTLKGRVEMGCLPDFSLLPGECAYVPTGAAIPEGGDAVVMLEYAETGAAPLIGLQKPAAPGLGVISAGEDARAGECVLPRGTRLSPRELGAMAALGHTRARVQKKPRVAVLSTGDELVPPDQTPGFGQIRDVNSTLLGCALAAMGAESLPYGILPDRAEAQTQALLQAASEADMVLLSGGSSVGERDQAAKLVTGLGEVLFHGLSVKPGKPTLAGEIRNTPVFGLPGNPVAAYMVFMLLARPLLLSMLGTGEKPRTVFAELQKRLPSNHGRQELVPVRLMGERAVPVLGKSALIRILTLSDGYVDIPRDAEGLEAGTKVEVTLWQQMG